MHNIHHFTEVLSFRALGLICFKTNYHLLVSPAGTAPLASTIECAIMHMPGTVYA